MRRSSATTARAEVSPSGDGPLVFFVQCYCATTRNVVLDERDRLLHCKVKSWFPTVANLTTTDPLVRMGSDQAPLAVQARASLELQCRTVDPPARKAVGVAFRVEITAFFCR